MKPTIIKGSYHSDARGTICFNNDFQPLGIKRFYTIENVNEDFTRAWQGHQIEQRWFTAVSGAFTIQLIELDDWVAPSRALEVLEFDLNSENLDVLHIPKGYISSIKANRESSKLLVFADYEMGEINDEFRFAKDYFSR